MKVGKPKSKRVPVRLRNKIQKASAAKQRKDRKEAKKNPQWRSRLKKDPGIPNLFPFKDKVLAEIEESRRRKEEEALKRRELAKAQRQGTAVIEKGQEMAVDDDDDDDGLVDHEEEFDNDDDDDEMEEDDQNPMAALLASAQARAQVFTKDANDDEDDEDDAEEEEEWTGVDNSKSSKPTKAKKTKTTVQQQPTRKVLPKQALEDPIKAVSLLLTRLERTQDGLQTLLSHYQIPPLVTANSDTTTRFLVEVARKRGRLSRGGVPNLPAAALTVLGDVNDERLLLPSLSPSAPAAGAGPQQTATGATGKQGKSQIVSQLAEPFRIEGLFGDDGDLKGGKGMEMEVEA